MALYQVRDKAMEWRKCQAVLKHDTAMGKFIVIDQIDLLKNSLAAENQEIN